MSARVRRNPEPRERRRADRIFQAEREEYKCTGACTARAADQQAIMERAVRFSVKRCQRGFTDAVRARLDFSSGRGGIGVRRWPIAIEGR